LTVCQDHICAASATPYCGGGFTGGTSAPAVQCAGNGYKEPEHQTGSQTMAAGYSATPLFRKLGLKPGMRAIALSPPDHYSTLLGTDAASVDWVSEMGKGLQFIHLFTRSAKE
tara:strand:- start:137 stop:475 length:339 start_codon:yes stop_codon:yes gene_type:complete